MFEIFLWVHYADFLSVSRFLSGISVASAECVAGTSLFKGGFFTCFLNRDI